MHGCGDEGFARAGGGAEDDVFVVEQFEDGFFLGGVEGEFFFGDVIEEAGQELIAGAAWGGREEAQQRVVGHGEGTVPNQGEVSIRD